MKNRLKHSLVGLISMSIAAPDIEIEIKPIDSINHNDLFSGYGSSQNIPLSTIILKN